MSVTVVAALVGLGLYSGLFFLQRPPGEREGLIRVATYQQLGGGNPVALTGHRTEEADWRVEIDGMWSGSRIADGDLVLSVRLVRDRPEPATSVDYHLEPLAEGERVVLGPVTIEVVEIHDAVLDRNDAADVRVVFDDSRLLEEPPPPDDVHSAHAPRASLENNTTAPPPAQETELTTLTIEQGTQDFVGDHRTGVMVAFIVDDVLTVRLLVDGDTHELAVGDSLALDDATTIEVAEIEESRGYEQRGGVTLHIRQ